jgi:hypothetical protein
MDASVLKIEYLNNPNLTEIVIMLGQQWSEKRLNETVQTINTSYPDYNINFDYRVLYHHHDRKPVYCYFFTGSSKYTHLCLARYIVQTIFTELAETARYNVTCYTKLNK